jgi:Uma2 family endonuclease
MTVADIVAAAPVRTVEDLLDELGGVPASRVLVHPPIGRATIQDVVDVRDRTRRICELVDGTLVEKPMGYLESMVAVVLTTALQTFVAPRKLGIVTGESGMMNLFADLVRIPDVAFTSRERLPEGKAPKAPVPRLAPDLAVEVLSASNTSREMARKRREYFQAGVRLVWIVDIQVRTVAVYMAPENPVVLTTSDVLDGGDVLPGFTLNVRELFAGLD